MSMAGAQGPFYNKGFPLVLSPLPFVSILHYEAQRTKEWSQQLIPYAELCKIQKYVKKLMISFSCNPTTQGPTRNDPQKSDVILHGRVQYQAMLVPEKLTAQVVLELVGFGVISITRCPQRFAGRARPGGPVYLNPSVAAEAGRVRQGRGGDPESVTYFHFVGRPTGRQPRRPALHPAAPLTPSGEEPPPTANLPESKPSALGSATMSEETVPEAASPPSAQGQQYFDRFSEDDPEYLRLRNHFSMMTPINDLHTADSLNLAKGERLMRCKISSVYRLLDLYGWAQLSDTYVTLRVSKEQDHFLISPKGVSCNEVTASSLVSAMKWGLLPVSHNALVVGDMAYYDFNGEMEQEADRINLQKCLGPTCKILVLRNHGVVALGDTVEEAFYKIFHLQAACEIQVSALSSAGGVENLILLEQEKHRPHEVGSVQWAGSTFGPMQKSRLGEHEFEALMRMLDNLGYRTGYTYRYPFVQEKTKHKSEVEIPATVTAFVFEEDGTPVPALRQHAQKQQKEKTRWLNTPNTYLRVNVADEVQRSMGSPRPKTTWMKADEVEKSSSGMPIRIENPNQFVPLYTDPQEVLDMRNKLREQNRQDVKSAGPQSQLLASVIAEKSRSPVQQTLPLSGGETCLPSGSASTESQLMSQGQADTKDEAEEIVPNPFSQLTDQELEEYKKEVERKKLELDGEKEPTPEEPGSPVKSAPASPAQSLAKSETKSPVGSPSKSVDEDAKKTETSKATTEPEATQPEGVVVNGREDERTAEDILSKSLSRMTTSADTDVDTSKDKTESVTSGPMSPEGSPSKSPSKKKKKFRTPSFLKKSKKKEKVES
ncbi:hypothetical protein E2I00_018416 [Balaenoptera physalus]|uniref:Class II aldolase/adducin N-terminal domain-containing protein n=1 Tax=Balaenoptera physalus TaxID=9770 RepID=A0A643BNG8_BALPH|nr:hypothetical protein E2I00_018416 [Balaenoptera physalus]